MVFCENGITTWSSVYVCDSFVTAESAAVGILWGSDTHVGRSVGRSIIVGSPRQRCPAFCTYSRVENALVARFVSFVFWAAGTGDCRSTRNNFV